MLPENENERRVNRWDEKNGGKESEMICTDCPCVYDECSSLLLLSASTADGIIILNCVYLWLLLLFLFEAGATAVVAAGALQMVSRPRWFMVGCLCWWCWWCCCYEHDKKMNSKIIVRDEGPSKKQKRLWLTCAEQKLLLLMFIIPHDSRYPSFMGQCVNMANPKEWCQMSFN